jgi:mannose-6-phosphate isomerase-like protein (cupin superfamily)
MIHEVSKVTRRFDFNCMEEIKMKRILGVILVLVAGICWMTRANAKDAMAAMSGEHKYAFTAGEIPYAPVPPILPAGAQLAVLEGNPMATTGDFTVRLKMPDGYKIPPHWHPHRENVTVISGEFQVGMGDDFDASKMMTFGPGSFAYLDPDMHHYAKASGEVVVQVHGESPFQINYIHPEDDPSKK